MIRLSSCLLILLASLACNTVRPNYEVRHGPLGAKADVKELRVTAPGYKPYASALGAVGMGLFVAGASNNIEGLFAGAFVGAITGLPIDLLLSIYGVYPGRGAIFRCPKLRPSHQVIMATDDHVNTVLDELACKKVARTLR